VLLAVAASLFVCRASSAAGEAIALASPDQRTRVIVSLDDNLCYSVVHGGKVLLAPSALSMELDGGAMLGVKPRLVGQQRRSQDQAVKTFYGKNAEIRDRYNETTLAFDGNYSLVVRAYDEGVAFRFATAIPRDITVKNEVCSFAFANDCTAYMIAGDKGRFPSYEGTYRHEPISRMDPRCTAVLPITAQTAGGPLVSIAESDLADYPGMYVSLLGRHGLRGVFRSYPSERDSQEQLRSLQHRNNDYIAKTNGRRSFPWRIVMISETDAGLMNNELVYLLAPEPRKGDDFTWVKPGNIIGWWDLAPKPGDPLSTYVPALTGVDFESGMNYETFKHYIDFAVEHNIDYVNIDAGWSDWNDLSKINPKFDLQRLLRYSKAKQKRVFLWCPAATLCKRLEEHLATFEKWGVAGLKVDFFDWIGSDNQLVVNEYLRIAAAAARHHLLLEYHGPSKPTAVCRAYPNVLTREAVLGSEFCGWSDMVSPENDVTIPFIRTLAGPFDYSPGAMRNASKKHFRPIRDLPMTQGTRCHQMAMFVVYYSPLQFLVDVPTNYAREPVCLAFLAAIPTTWDKTLPLGGKIGQYVTVARRKADTWYVGSMTNWDERTLDIRCDFLDKKTYRAEIFQDGINANANAIDWRKIARTVSSNDVVTIHLAKGGGWVARFVPIR
jgi:alpha-glucosidase